MTTIIRYELFFSRRSDHPFLAISTSVWNGRKLLHSHTDYLNGEYDWERRELWEKFRLFRNEESSRSETCYRVFEDFKSLAVTKTWEG